MANEIRPNEDLRTVWQKQKTEGVHMSVDEIRLRAGKHSHKIAWRNAREYIAALAVTVFFSFSFWHTEDTLTRAGFVLMVGGLIYVCWHLHANGSWRRMPENLGAENCLQFHRRELERQRDLLRGVWRWYLGPMVPGMVVLMVAIARTNPGHLKHFGSVVAVYDTLVVLFFVFVGWLNERAARKLQKKIDELTIMGGERE